MSQLGPSQPPLASARKRWKLLHRARRVFEHRTQEHLREVLAHGSAVMEGGPGAEYLSRLVDMAINPPVIHDPEIPRA